MPRTSAQNRTLSLFCDPEGVWTEFVRDTPWDGRSPRQERTEIQQERELLLSRLRKLTAKADRLNLQIGRVDESLRALDDDPETKARALLASEADRLGAKATHDKLLSALREAFPDIARAQRKREACKRVKKAADKAEGSIGSFFQNALLDVLDTEGMTSAMITKALRDAKVVIERRTATKVLTALAKEGKVAIEGSGAGKLYRRVEVEACLSG